MSESNSKPNVVIDDPSTAGRRGGKSSSEAKTAAARSNGKLGGRPRKYATASDRQRAYLARKAAKQCA